MSTTQCTFQICRQHTTFLLDETDYSTQIELHLLPFTSLKELAFHALKEFRIDESEVLDVAWHWGGEDCNVEASEVSSSKIVPSATKRRLETTSVMLHVTAKAVTDEEDLDDPMEDATMSFADFEDEQLYEPIAGTATPTKCALQICRNHTTVQLGDSTHHMQVEQHVVASSSLNSLVFGALRDFGIRKRQVQSVEWHWIDEVCSAEASEVSNTRLVPSTLMTKLQTTMIMLHVTAKDLARAAEDEADMDDQMEDTAMTSADVEDEQPQVMVAVSIQAAESLPMDTDDATLTPFPSSFKVAELPRIFAQLVELVFNRSESHELQQMIETKQYVFPFTTSIKSNADVAGHWILIDSEDIRLDTLADLFKVPNGMSNQLNVRITVRAEEAQSPYQHLAEAIWPDLRSDEEVHYRLGIASVEKRILEHGVRRHHVLLAFHPKGNAEAIGLFSVPVYELNGLCIGDHRSDVHYPITEHEGHQYLPPFEVFDDNTFHLDELTQRVQQYAREEHPETIKAALPTLPTFCYNTFDPEPYGLGVTHWPDKYITLAIRCVNHYKLADGKEFEFPMSITFRVAKINGHVDYISDLIAGYLIEAGQELQREAGSGTVSPAILYKAPLKNTWSMELWVMPQAPGLKKLFRFRTRARRSNGRELTDFLHPEAVLDGDRCLYMEAHIAPKGRAWVPTGKVEED